MKLVPPGPPRLPLTFNVPASGRHALDFRYANGNGPTNTANKCAIRTLRNARGQLLGTVVLPQRGQDAWSSGGYSNPLLVDLPAGRQKLTLDYELADISMNGPTNHAMLDCLPLTRGQ